MPLTINGASDDVAFMFIDLVTDNLKKPEDKHANETAAKAKFDKMIVKITRRDFTPANLKKLCKTIETKIVGYAEMTRDIPGAYKHPSSAKPLMPKSVLDPIRKKLARDACDYFDDFAQDTLLNFGRSSSSSSSREKKSRRVKRVGGNKSQKRR